ncbi:urease accessory UreF family protein [Pseudonocardia kongjuensis]|uniref:Urease accessory UreF family protein n=1 Tax=Pseudonocardia kongjuensis TaxID=102227 RepID=A0ABN1XG54_9PSEU
MTGLASLVLADARFPGGGHVHSGGLEEAVSRDLVSDVDTLAGFLRGRLRTAGRVAACFAAAAADRAARAVPVPAAESGDRSFVATADWVVLDRELDARTPSAAQREASRTQGRAALRAVRTAWPSPVLGALLAADPRPHHPLLVGAVIGRSGEDPAAAARCTGYLAVSGPASAAVRLLGLDPFAVNAALVALGAELDAIVLEAAALAPGPVADLPAPGAPVLDLMAESHVRHHRERVRLFAS